KKAKANKAKHGVDFELAKDVFRDPACLSSLDDSSEDEERWRIIGLTGGKVLLVVFTERNNDVIRIISAREANKREEREYFGQTAPEGWPVVRGQCRRHRATIAGQGTRLVAARRYDRRREAGLCPQRARRSAVALSTTEAHATCAVREACALDHRAQPAGIR